MKQMQPTHKNLTDEFELRRRSVAAIPLGGRLHLASERRGAALPAEVCNPFGIQQWSFQKHLWLMFLIAALLLAGSVGVRAQSTNAAAGYSTFGKFISERNIFNPNRYARAANTKYVPRARTVRRNSFALAGTMSYDEGENAGLHAFFDGTSADFRKALQLDGTIAVFKITAITPDSVTLVFDTNTTVLKLGQQMRDDGRGHWTLSTETVSYAQNSSNSGRRGNPGRRNETSSDAPPENANVNPSDAQPDPGMDQGEPPPDAAEPPADNAPAETVTLPSGPVSDAIRRLMELRAQEEQQSGNRN